VAYSQHLFLAGETVTASTLNGATYYNWLVSAVGVVTTAGDVAYATAANALARLGIGAAGDLCVPNAGATAPEWKALVSSVGSATATWNGTSSGNWVSDVLTCSITPGGAYGKILILAAAQVLSDDVTRVRCGIGADDGPEARFSGGPAFLRQRAVRALRLRPAVRRAGNR